MPDSFARDTTNPQWGNLLGIALNSAGSVLANRQTAQAPFQQPAAAIPLVGGGGTTSQIIQLLSRQGDANSQILQAQAQKAVSDQQDYENKWKTVLSIAAAVAPFVI